MNRRGFIARLVTLPFIGSAIGRMLGVKADVKPEVVILRHTGDRSCCILARLRAEAAEPKTDREHPMDAAMKRLHDFSKQEQFYFDRDGVKHSVKISG